MNLFIGIFIPFAGTVAGAACVLFLRNHAINGKLQQSLLGFAAGVMVAASVWSLLIPSMDMASDMGNLAFVPAAVGFLLGIVGLMLLDRYLPVVSVGMFLAVTLHNIPEGMAVGVAFAGALSENEMLTLASAFSLSIGIAIQNFPEGAIVSLPLAGSGMAKGKAFLLGGLSGIVEPIAAGLTLLLASFVKMLLPYFLSFAAGAMLYVVVEELIPGFSEEEGSEVGIGGFAIGFVIMMIVDVVFS